MGPRLRTIKTLFVITVMVSVGVLIPIGSMADDGYKDFKVERHIWDNDAGEFISWSPDGRYVVSQLASNQKSDYALKYYDLQEGWNTYERVDTSHSGNIYSMDWSPDSTKLATTQRELIIIDVAGGWVPGPSVTVDSSIIRTVDWHPTEDKVALGTEIGALYVVNTKTLEIEENFSASGRWIEEVQWSPDGKMLAVSDVDGEIMVYDTTRWLDEDQRWVEKWHFSKHTNSVKGLAWSPDGTELISTSFDSKIYLWDMIKGKFERLIGGHGEDVAIFDVQWNEVSGYVLTAGAKYILVWDSSSWSLLQKIEFGYNNKPVEVNTVSWDPDGKKFVSTGFTSVDLWSQNVHDKEKWDWFLVCGILLVIGIVGMASWSGFYWIKDRRLNKERGKNDKETEEGDEK